MKVLVLLSGGQDSATCLALATVQFPGQVAALCFDYQQRHRVEIERAKELAAIAEVPFEIIALPFISQLTENALTRKDHKIDVSQGQLPTSFVEGRNLFFLSVAAVYAKQRQISSIYAGMCQTDYSGYPDCRYRFIESAAKTINLALDETIRIHTPLMWMTKAETVLLMQKCGKLDWYRYTHTCYEGQRPACGQCPACQLRLKGFKEAGIADPLE